MKKKEKLAWVIACVIAIFLILFIMGCVFLLSYYLVKSSTEYEFCKEKGFTNLYKLKVKNFDNYTNIICDKSMTIYKVKKDCLDYDEFREVCVEYKYVEVRKHK